MGAAYFKNVLMINQKIPVAGFNKKYCHDRETNLVYYRCINTGAYLVIDLETGKNVYTIDGESGSMANNYVGTKNVDYSKTILDENNHVLLNIDERDIDRRAMTGRVEVSTPDGKVLYTIERTGICSFEDYTSGKTFNIDIKTDHALNEFCFYLSKSSEVVADKQCIAKTEKKGAKVYIHIAANVDVTMILAMYLARRKMLNVFTGGQGVGGEWVMATALISDLRGK